MVLETSSHRRGEAQEILLVVLGEFGCSVACLGDLSGDGEVGTGDIHALLAVFGSDCP